MAKFKKLRRPCRQCPFLRTSVQGYLGSDTPEHFIELTLRDADMPCHMTIDYSQPDWLEKQEPEADLCVGAMQFQNNYMKLSRDPAIAEAQSIVGGNDAVFSSPEEFLIHHKWGQHDSPTEPSVHWRAAAVDHARGLIDISYIQAIGTTDDRFDGRIYLAYNDADQIIAVAVDPEGDGLKEIKWLRSFYDGRGEIRWHDLPMDKFSELVRSMESVAAQLQEREDGSE